MRKILNIIIAAVTVAIAVTGCGGGEKKTAAADSLAIADSLLAKVKWPVKLPDSCQIDSAWISRSDSTMSARLTVGVDYIDSAAVANDEGVRKMLAGMLLQDKAIAATVEAARKVPLTLAVTVGDNYGSIVSFTLPAKQFHAMVLSAPDERQRDELKVSNRVRYDNQYCPIELEDGVSVQSMTIQDRYVTFHTLIDVEKLDFKVMKENRDSVGHAVVTALRAQLEDAEQEKSLREIAGARLGYRNRYVASDGADSFDISFTPADIEKLLFVTDSIRNATKKPKSKH